MKKKIFALLLIFFSLGIVNVYADKEYKFTINNTLENREIIYTWENNISNFSFEMVSPSKDRYSLSNYSEIDYDSSSNKLSIRFPELEKGTWKVFFKGDSDPLGLKNKIAEYIPDETSFPAIDNSLETSDNNSSSSTESSYNNTPIIIIGADPTPTPEITNEESTEQNTEENNENQETIENNEQNVNQDITEEIEARKALLKEEREAARLNKKEILDSYSKPAEKETKEELNNEEVLNEETNEDGEVLLNFDDIQNVETEVPEENEEQKVIFLGGETTDETQEVSMNPDSLVTGTDDLSIININADEERAKEKARQDAIKANQVKNNIIMVLPFIICSILVVLDVILEKKRKKTIGMVDLSLKSFDSYVDRREDVSYRYEDSSEEDVSEEIGESVEEVIEGTPQTRNKKGFSLFGKKNKNIVEEIDIEDNLPNIQNPLDEDIEENEAIRPPMDFNNIDENTAMLPPKVKKGSFGFNSEDLDSDIDEELDEDFDNMKLSSISSMRVDDSIEESRSIENNFKENTLGNIEDEIEETIQENKKTSAIKTPTTNNPFADFGKKSKKSLFGDDDSLSFKRPSVEEEEDFNWDD